MPQHPQYSNSPEKNLEDLFKVLTDMERFGFIHEDIYQPIEALMSDMYSEVVARFHRAENSSLDESEDGIEEDEEFESYGTVSVSDLWQYINESEKEQFIQDFESVQPNNDHEVFCLSMALFGLEKDMPLKQQPSTDPLAPNRL